MAREDALLMPPMRYACIDGHIYRGGYPLPEHAPFLQRLELRTIISVTPEPLQPLPGLDGVDLVHISSTETSSKSKKKRGVPLSKEIVFEALNIAVDPARQPVYVHCLNGQQVTSLIAAVLRVSQGWALPSVLEEFIRFDEYDRKDIAFIEQCANAYSELDQDIEQSITTI